ncbi:restriction endonuclease subunit S [Paracoccus yeei]|uniref:restriction endonuclease subunit S n=1 Tax=Paracoccus yeei TaxID=147645 RepID=UPI003BF82CF5
MSAPVPSGWTETTLGRVLQRSPSYGINAPALPRGVGKYPYLRITDIDEAGRVDIGSLPSVRDTASDTYILSEGDIVVARTGASVGKSHLFKDAGEPVVFAGFLIRLSADENAILPSYLAQLMQTAHYWDWIRENSARSGQPGVNSQQLKTIPILLPPLPEQRGIAAALSDADGVVAGLERVIAKKRLIKQGAMQDLLTARRRLPGFSGEWEVKKLAQLGDVKTGLTYKPENVKPFGTLVLRSSNIQNDRLAFDSNVFVDVDVSDEATVKTGDLLICVRNGSRQLIGKTAMIDSRADGMAFGAFMSAFRSEINDYLLWCFQSFVVQNQIAENLGATINQITNKTMKGIEIPLPKDETERRAITAVLSDMDAEIQTLESRLAKARAVKEGMMQNLLTGRVRLV